MGQKADEGGTGRQRRIYTKGGDDGSTGLLYGGRTRKDDPRIEACGAIDEAVAAIGLARALRPSAEGLTDLLLGIQRQLFAAGAELATSRENLWKLVPKVTKVTDEMVNGLEREIDRMVEISPLPDYFVVPGETPAGAALDAARTLVRKAERRATTLAGEAALADNCVLRYLNRLSDLLFVAARLEEKSRGVAAPASRTSLEN